MAEWFSQHPHGVRFDWGLAGAAAHASSSSCLVIVDILSFTTSVTVAVEAGTRVFPYAWRDEMLGRAELTIWDWSGVAPVSSGIRTR